MVVFEYTLRIVHVKLFSSSNYSLETEKIYRKRCNFSNPEGKYCHWNSRADVELVSKVYVQFVWHCRYVTTKMCILLKLHANRRSQCKVYVVWPWLLLLLFLLLWLVCSNIFEWNVKCRHKEQMKLQLKSHQLPVVWPLSQYLN